MVESIILGVMKMSFLAYAQLPISCIIILLFMVVQLLRNPQDTDRKFMPTVLSSLLFMVFDLLIATMEDGIISFSPFGFEIAYIGYNAAGCIMIFTWFRYGEIIVDFGAYTSKIMRFFHIAAAVCLALICIPPLYPYFYTIGEDFSITYEFWDNIWYVMHFMPGVIALIEAFKAYNNVRRYAVRERYMPILIFYIVLLFCAFLQNFTDKVFSMALGIMLSVYYLFVVSLRSGISKDSLTGLNNRRQFLLDADSGMKSVMSHHSVMDDSSNEETLFLIMMDMDNFKMINDTKGHNVGDKALVDFANNLKTTCQDYEAKIYRYGGDEFAILVGSSWTEQVRDLCRRIAENTSNIYDDSIDYKLSVSIGFAAYDPNTMKSIPSFTEAADKQLYIAKQAFHANNPR